LSGPALNPGRTGNAISNARHATAPSSRIISSATTAALTIALSDGRGMKNNE
jgi:hypothetical protein